MLTKTFFHIPGGGIKLEQHIWNQGCFHWEQFLEDPGMFDTGDVPLDLAEKVIVDSWSAYQQKNFTYFDRALGPLNAWRAWPEFQKETVYLDIETDGTFEGEAVTMVGLYDGKNFECLVRGKDLDRFPEIMAQYSVIVTFFGTGFDLPMLKKRFPQMSLGQIHIDLCPTLRTLGYSGGLKKIEKQLGIDRGGELANLTGRDAISLWKGYQRGCENSLKKLIAYNREDVVNLKVLIKIAYSQLAERLGYVQPKIACKS